MSEKRNVLHIVEQFGSDYIIHVKIINTIHLDKFDCITVFTDNGIYAAHNYKEPSDPSLYPLATQCDNILKNGWSGYMVFKKVTFTATNPLKKISDEKPIS